MVVLNGCKHAGKLFKLSCKWQNNVYFIVLTHWTKKMTLVWTQIYVSLSWPNSDDHEIIKQSYHKIYVLAECKHADINAL